MICPQCGVRVAEDAPKCYNCKLDLVKAEVEVAKASRTWSFSTVAFILIGAICVYYAVVEGYRYSTWSNYHAQIKKINSFDASFANAPAIPIRPDDPVQGTLKSWPHRTDPYGSDLVVDNSVTVKE